MGAGACKKSADQRIRRINPACTACCRLQLAPLLAAWQLASSRASSCRFFFSLHFARTPAAKVETVLLPSCALSVKPMPEKRSIGAGLRCKMSGKRPAEIYGASKEPKLRTNSRSERAEDTAEVTRRVLLRATGTSESGRTGLTCLPRSMRRLEVHVRRLPVVFRRYTDRKPCETPECESGVVDAMRAPICSECAPVPGISRQSCTVCR